MANGWGIYSLSGWDSHDKLLFRLENACFLLCVNLDMGWLLAAVLIVHKWYLRWHVFTDNRSHQEAKQQKKCRTLWGQAWTNWYLIVGNFQERKLSRISWFCGYSWKFSPQNLGAWHLWRCKSEQSANVFSTKIMFFTNLQKFSPSKVSRYMVLCHCMMSDEHVQNLNFQCSVKVDMMDLQQRTPHCVHLLWSPSLLFSLVLMLQTQSVSCTLSRFIGVELHHEESSVAVSRSIGMELDSEGSIMSTCTEH